LNTPVRVAGSVIGGQMKHRVHCVGLNVAVGVGWATVHPQCTPHVWKNVAVGVGWSACGVRQIG
jgi:hypothetical protein